MLCPAHSLHLFVALQRTHTGVREQLQPEVQGPLRPLLRLLLMWPSLWVSCVPSPFLMWMPVLSILWLNLMTSSESPLQRLQSACTAILEVLG